MNSVKDSSALDPLALQTRLRTSALRQGFRVETYGKIDRFPLLAMTKRTPGPKPRVYLSAGTHGDEPAGPAALLRLLDQGFFDARAVWFLCPMINPLGLSLRTRENADGLDLNRDYRGVPRSQEVQSHVRWLQSQPNFHLSICLHEDWEAVGFYVYERDPEPNGPVAESMIRAVSRVCPIEFAEIIDGRPAQGGIIRGLEDAVQKELWAEAVYLWVNHAKTCYTTESPSSLPLEQRVAAQCLAVQIAVEHQLKTI